MNKSPVKIITVVGARPQFVKAAAVSSAIIELNIANPDTQIEEIIIHTGQHYDANMSDIFFNEMKIPAPKYNLGLGGGSHGAMTGRMLEKIEEVLLLEKPDWLLVYGDTNSTLAGALAAKKLYIRVAHVEAGLRSFNMKMPEEINRILTDRISNLLFCPTNAAVDNLKKEGFATIVNDTCVQSHGTLQDHNQSEDASLVYNIGDVMYDAALMFGKVARERSTILKHLNLVPKHYYLATVHRAENTDDHGRLKAIMRAFQEIGTPDCPVIFSIHPRTRKMLEKLGLYSELADENNPNKPVHITDPVGFIDMVNLEQEAKIILTDSGGVQKEAYFHSVPCVTLRDETEWVETVQAGCNKVVGADEKKIIAAAESSYIMGHIGDYGDGTAAQKIVALMQGM